MKKYAFLTFLAASWLAAAPCTAQTDLEQALPLLQTPRNAALNAQVLQLFRSAKKPDLVFAAGASLVKTPPPASAQPALLNIVLRNDDALKKTMAAVIITASGAVYPELSPILSDAAQSQDNALRAYAAGAYVILNPQETAWAQQVVNLYIYDEAFAQRAMNLLAKTPKQTFAWLKTSARSQDPQVRAAAAAWLGDLHNAQAAKELLKLAKTETDRQAANAIAAALAKNKEYTLTAAAKELKRDYNSPQAATYALALGFMTGSAVDALKQGLQADNVNTRINSARAAAYMAGVLHSKEAGVYSSDKNFDELLLKGLIPQLNALQQTDKDDVKIYAQNALEQIAKLMR